MASFSSIGIGLGGNVDVNALIKASVDAVKLPITKTGGLQQQAAVTNAKVSAFGQFKSLVSALADAAGKLNSVTGWNGVKASSSNTDAVSVSAVGGAAATSFSVQVQNLATAQSSISAALQPTKQPVGEGTLTVEIGSWAGDPKAFTAGEATAVSIDVSATDTLADVASKINGAKAGVTATVLNDGTGERLLLRSNSTGEAAGYRLSVADADGGNDDGAGLSRLVAGATTEYARNANATVNGIAVSSPTNAFADTVAGVTFTAAKVTTEPVTITVEKDSSAVKKNIEAFVAAYNAVNSALNESTKYDKETQTSALLQGDSTVMTLQNTLRMALQSVNGSGVLRNLSAVGVVSAGGLGSGNLSPDGSLELDATKFNKAMEDPDAVKAFFRGPDGGDGTEGFAGKFKAVTDKLLASDGFFATKTKTYDSALKLNAKEVERINDRAERLEKSLTQQYTALDTKMASLNALSTYIAQQVTTWNKSS
ncbi:flagellar hook-associated protein 2 [Alicycliphilus denitrificans]|uniref:flagellar filament capping protein FliD n=1 Tax=Alicycliphilus denitrificans TaxID=179636 RepID=UPI0009690343|nr:flagellar filament capping protein FliD [Alicycliphilus denitrificans]MBN9576261.1 flagellar filament capping protein FliD [Alicycliphilus denitrificans]OJW85514.1 MAG: flagellar cap protein FliD [Alicycliphilus sp. 69-12]BCN40753.1 flagellar hook-associated protein 2 [Alicycliphilus denitrificans]